MAIINKIDNVASVSYDGSTIASNPVSTILLLAPTILKAVDQSTASIGDILTYTITVANAGLSAISDLPLTDNIPVGSTFVTDSFKVNGNTATPTIAANVLTYTIPTIPALGIATIQFQVDVIGGSI